MKLLFYKIFFSKPVQAFIIFLTKIRMARVKVISFDIFDTLVNRPFCDPRDIFQFIANVYKEPDFYNFRKNAENVARAKLKKQLVTYDDIYQCMPTKYFKFKEIEASLEFDTIYPNPVGKKLYDYALKKGKKIIFTSDMYFSGEYLRRLLTKNGYPICEKIYVSSDLQKAKYQGTLFPHIIQELKVKPSQMIHIGDNKKSDYLSARQSKMKAIRITSQMRIAFKLYPKLKELYIAHRHNLTISVVLGLLIKKLTIGCAFEGYWDEFGYIYGGGVCYGLSNFIVNQMDRDGIRELLCVARDGYTIEKIVNLIAPHIKTHYVFASRAINLLTSLECENELPWTNKGISIIRMFKELSEEFSKRCEGKKWENKQEQAAFIKENYDILRPYALAYSDAYMKYVEALKLEGEKIALFDISAGSFNSLRLLMKFLPNKELLGLYWLIGGKDVYNCRAYQRASKHKLVKYDMLELLVTAPELPVRNISTELDVVRFDNKYERERAQVYRQICIGEIQFAQDYLETYKQTIAFDVDTLIDIVNVICTTRSYRDIWHFRKIYQGIDEAHTCYRKII